MEAELAPIDLREIHSQRSAAEYCKVSPNTVRNWILTRRLPATRANGRINILQRDLDIIQAERQLVQNNPLAKQKSE